MWTNRCKWDLLIWIGVSYLGIGSVWCQSVPRDTSYTVRSAYLKAKKNHPDITIASVEADEDVKVQRDIVYRHVGARNLTLDVYTPMNFSKPMATVVMIHGGGWRSGDKVHMQEIGTSLANQGYLAIALAYRLSPEAKYPAAVDDVRAAIQWVIDSASKLNVDTSRLVLLGCSAGAQLASLVGVTQAPGSVQVKAIVNLDGILAFHHPESEEGVSASLWLGGNYEENPSNWMAASALNYVGPDEPTILFVNSQYPRFHAGRDDMIAILDQENIYSEVHELPDTPHTFWLFNPWFDPTMSIILTFLDRVLAD